MILIALGSNLDGPWGSPRKTVERAVRELDKGPVRLRAVSRFLETKPYGRSKQQNFINAVACVETHLSPQALLARLQMTERAAGRKRSLRWGPRTLDLDIIDYNGRLVDARGGLRQTLQLPHPGIADRYFVLKPLAELAPGWRHPVSRRKAGQLLRRLRGAGHGEEL